MASARLIAKLVTTAGNISSGAVQALGSHPSSERGLHVIAPILELLAETICVHSSPDAETLDQLASYLETLAMRYGTIRRAMDALAHGRRRHPLVSLEKAQNWFQAMSVTAGAIEPTLRRHATLMIHVSKWMKDQGLEVEQRLDAYQAWLDSPLPTPPTPTAQEPHHATPAVAVAEAQSPPVTIVFDTQPLATAPAIAESDDDLRAALEAMVEAKYFGDNLDECDQRESIHRLAESNSPGAKAITCIIRRDFAGADAAIAAMDSRLPPALTATIRGDRAFFSHHFDDAIPHFRRADEQSPSAWTRMNLAVALGKAQRSGKEDNLSAAIDILDDAAGSLPEGSREWARVRTALGVGWLHAAGETRERRCREAITCFESAASVLSPANDSDWWGETQLQLGVAWIDFPVGSRAENIDRAMTHLKSALSVWSREAQPRRWSIAQNHLGHAWERLPRGNREDNLSNAIDCYSIALAARSRESNPVSWARLQNNLGNAWIQYHSGTTEHRQNIEKAITCHTAALEVWTRLNRRADWAATQNNLGNAWALLPADAADKERNLRRAIACYKAALEVRTRATSPNEWAATLNNLGTALLHLPPSKKDTQLHEAVDCFRKALEVRTRDAAPIEWAKTQQNLGHAWSRMTDGDRQDNLGEAVAYYEAALEVFSLQAHPHQHQLIKARLEEARDRLSARHYD